MKLDELKDKKIYLASPYTHFSRIIMKRRFEQVCFHAGTLIGKGALVFCPIAHTHPIAVCNELPRDFDFWKNYDETFIEWCEVFVVCGMDGWELSDGVIRELKLAKELDRHCYLWNLETGQLEVI